MKKIIFFMTVFACVFSLVSCGKKKTQKKASGERELSTVEKKYEGKLTPPEYDEGVFDLGDEEVDDFGFDKSEFEYIE
ncbi:hypothetical protein HNP77_001158 [Treponema rectale]|uniref:Lipoprotein n=1 Tax=Treponema rectale TaxID=744512 RepID=A0A840S845_9SPIR|nr:hypothetical protein [Treponema rectale]MBB5218789.1 hypothetical protein [Treponema rectale]